MYAFIVSLFIDWYVFLFVVWAFSYLVFIVFSQIMLDNYLYVCIID